MLSIKIYYDEKNYEAAVSFLLLKVIGFYLKHGFLISMNNKTLDEWFIKIIGPDNKLVDIRFLPLTQLNVKTRKKSDIVLLQESAWWKETHWDVVDEIYKADGKEAKVCVFNDDNVSSRVRYY